MGFQLAQFTKGKNAVRVFGKRLPVGQVVKNHAGVQKH